MTCRWHVRAARRAAAHGGFKSPLSHHVVADFVSFATTFSFTQKTSSLIHSVAPPFQIEPASLGFDLVFSIYGDLNSRAAVNDMPGEKRACAASGRKSRLAFSAAVKEPEEMRKPERFFGNRKVDCQSREAGRRARRLQVSSLSPTRGSEQDTVAAILTASKTILSMVYFI